MTSMTVVSKACIADSERQVERPAHSISQMVTCSSSTRCFPSKPRQAMVGLGIRISPAWPTEVAVILPGLQLDLLPWVAGGANGYRLPQNSVHNHCRASAASAYHGTGADKRCTERRDSFRSEADRNANCLVRHLVRPETPAGHDERSRPDCLQLQPNPRANSRGSAGSMRTMAHMLPANNGNSFFHEYLT